MLGVERQRTLNEVALSLAPPSGRYVVVSRRCTVIYLSSKQFRDIAARENVDEAALSDAVMLYPDDSRICRHVSDVERWNADKKRTVEEHIVDKASNVMLRNFRYFSSRPSYYWIMNSLQTAIVYSKDNINEYRNLRIQSLNSHHEITYV